jgi:hypothetical protein
MARGDAAPLLETGEEALNAPAVFVNASVVTMLALSMAAWRNDSSAMRGRVRRRPLRTSDRRRHSRSSGNRVALPPDKTQTDPASHASAAQELGDSCGGAFMDTRAGCRDDRLRALIFS